ncbi:MAG: hypothetical protein NZL83_04410 [Candidatus Absconditabacterales bacterium]|nr:hypothetical protein [Candidatus Absconditabacterales bacterium]
MPKHTHSITRSQERTKQNKRNLTICLLPGTQWLHGRLISQTIINPDSCISDAIAQTATHLQSLLQPYCCVGVNMGGHVCLQAVKKLYDEHKYNSTIPLPSHLSLINTPVQTAIYVSRLLSRTHSLQISSPSSRGLTHHSILQFSPTEQPHTQEKKTTSLILPCFRRRISTYKSSEQKTINLSHIHHKQHSSMAIIQHSDPTEYLRNNKIFFSHKVFFIIGIHNETDSPLSYTPTSTLYRSARKNPCSSVSYISQYNKYQSIIEHKTYSSPQKNSRLHERHSQWRGTATKCVNTVIFKNPIHKGSRYGIHQRQPNDSSQSHPKTQKHHQI